MPFSPEEKVHRRSLEIMYEKARPIEMTKEVMRETAISAFVKRLDEKLALIKDGEGLVINIEMQPVDADGHIFNPNSSRRHIPAYKAWREAVFARDNFACQKCGATEDIQAHHIKAWATFPEGRFDVENGLTLCRGCHALQHPELHFI